MVSMAIVNILIIMVISVGERLALIRVSAIKKDFRCLIRKPALEALKAAVDVNVMENRFAEVKWTATVALGLLALQQEHDHSGHGRMARSSGGGVPE